MNIEEVMAGIKKGRHYSRPSLKVGKRYSVKIVSLDGNPWVWSRSSIPGVTGWDRLNDIDELEEEHKNADDWVRVTRPAP